METILGLVGALTPRQVFALFLAAASLIILLLYLLFWKKEKTNKKEKDEEEEEEKSGFYIRLEREFSNCLGLLHVFGEFMYDSDLMKSLHKQKDKTIAFYMKNFSEDLKEITFLPLIPKKIYSVSHLLGLLYKNGFLHGKLDYTINELRLVEDEDTPKEYSWAYNLHFIEVMAGQDPFELLKKNNLVGITANVLLMAGLTDDRWWEVDLVCTGTLLKCSDGTKVPLILHTPRKEVMPTLSPLTGYKNNDRKVFVVGATHIEGSNNKK